MRDDRPSEKVRRRGKDAAVAAALAVGAFGVAACFAMALAAWPSWVASLGVRSRGQLSGFYWMGLLASAGFGVLMLWGVVRALRGECGWKGK